MRADISLLPLALLLLLLPLAAPFTCLDAAGTPLDWFIAIKYPASNVPPGNFYAVVYSSSPSAWVNRSFQLDSPSGDPITNTVKQMYAADNTFGSNVSFTHAMYNDDPPNATAASSGFAHAKGFLAANQTNGFWLAHSVPNWPSALTVGYLPFPTSSQGKYAQSFICLSMNASTTNLIGISLLKMRPKYYSSSMPSPLLPLFPDIAAALRSSGVISTLPYTLFVDLMSIGIGAPPRRFTSFAKSVKFEQDVWNDFIAPSIGTSLYMEGWVNGGVNGSTLNSSCGVFPATSTMRISSVAFNAFSPAPISTQLWSTTLDHSKWAVSACSSVPAVCVGDMNRQRSQFTRGGGAICLQDNGAFGLFSVAVRSFFSCCRDSSCQNICPAIRPSTSAAPFSSAAAPTTAAPTTAAPTTAAPATAPPSPPPSSLCSSLLSCTECNIKRDCGWCSSSSSSSACMPQGQNLTCSQWAPDASQCQSASNQSSVIKQKFAFRLSNMKVEDFTPGLQEEFLRGVASLFRSGVEYKQLSIVAVRAGSVIVDTEIVSSNAPIAAAVSAILVNPDALRAVPAFGDQLSSIALPSDSVCTPASSSSSCSASAGCGWCRLSASCLPGTSLGATAPAVCTGSSWLWSDDGCFVKLAGRCLLLWHVVLIAVAAATLHLLHVVLFLRVTRGASSGCSPQRCLAGLPGIGLFAWFSLLQKRRRALASSHNLLQHRESSRPVSSPKMKVELRGFI